MKGWFEMHRRATASALLQNGRKVGDDYNSHGESNIENG